MGFLTGKTAIITGAGRAVLSDGSCGSIGYGIATAFAKEGANLVITGRNVKKLEEAKNELEAKYGIRVLPVQADVCAGTDNEATVQNVVNQTVDTFGGIQVLVNNAQASASGVPLAEHTTEQFDLALYSGLYAAFYYMKACYPYLAKSKGSVINFASGAGLFGNFGQCSYAAAKEGIRGLSRVAATEWGKDGINVNVICPLAWTAKLEQFQQAYPDAFKANVKMPPMGHYANPETEIGRVCVPISQRIGLLDRKLRVISENTDTEEEWFTWTKRAFQSVYGFEYQGDSLLLARENLFVTFVEVYRERFGKLPHLRQRKVIANIIAWNLWQMDGTKYVVPGSCKENKIEIISWFGSEEQIDLCPGCKSGNIRAHNGIYSIIKDWRSNQTMTFLSMVRGGKASGSV